MITRVRVKNFRSLADIDVQLGPLTVLVGRNGAGKSAFVDVLRFVRDALWPGGLDAAINERNGIAKIRRWSPNGARNIEISLTIESPDLSGEYSFAVGSGEHGSYFIKHEHYVQDQRDNVKIDFEIKDKRWVTAPPNPFMPQGADPYEIPFDPNALFLPRLSVLMSNESLSTYLVGNEFYTIYPGTLRGPQTPSTDYPLREDGRNLAPVLERIQTQTQWFPDLLAVLRRVVDVTGIRIKPVGSAYLIIELRHQEQNGRAPWFDLSQESDGTIRLLGILAALYQEGPHKLIAIEEPELTLHPGALGVLSDVIKETSLRHQVLITTQSPDLISRFGADELRIVERVNGITQIGSLEEKQREAINEELFSAGDLLRIEGLHSTYSEPEEVGNA